MQRFLYGDYKPDQPANLNDGLTACSGVYPIANGYAPLPSFSAMQNGTLAGVCLGAGGYRYTGSSYLFAATATNIYTYSLAGYTSIKGSLTTPPDNTVRFCPYGAYMLITNGTNPIQKFDPASPSATTDLNASAPTARFLAVVRGFVVAGYAGGSPLRVQWSDTGNSASWTPGSSSQAGQYDMASGGDITGVVGGEYGLIFQERRIVRMSYTATDTVWSFDELATDVGCVAPRSLATFGRVTFCWSNKGFIACDGSSVQLIGDEKIDRTFAALSSASYFDKISAVVDPRRSLYIVAVPSSNPASQIFIYNYALQRWSTAQVTAEFLFSALSLTTSLEDLDAIYGNLDAIPFSLDSAQLSTSYPLLLLFDGSHRLGSLSGPNIAASFSDGIKEYVPGYVARVRAVRPLCDAGSVSVTYSGRNALSDTETATTYNTRTHAGVVRVRENWNLAQVTIDIPAGTSWSFIQGYDIDVQAGRML